MGEEQPEGEGQLRLEGEGLAEGELRPGGGGRPGAGELGHAETLAEGWRAVVRAGGRHGGLQLAGAWQT